MPERRVVDVVREVVADVDPEQLSDFDFVAESYTRNPRAARRPQRAGNEATGSSWQVAGAALTSLVCAVGVDVCKDFVVDGAKKLWSLRRPKVGLDTPAPELPADRSEELKTRALELAKEFGASDELAEQVAASMVKRWTPRR